MKAITREELKAPFSSERSPSLARTSSATPDLCPWVLSPSRERADTAQRQARFVAGTTFFNYSDYGSLRPGQEPIQLASRQYFGFAVHAFVCGFAFNYFSYGHGRLLAEYLKANDEHQVKAANYVLVWPSTLSILIGLISDSFPICGFQRKSYMILGWILTFSMCIALVVMDQYSNSRRFLYPSSDIDDTMSSPFVGAYLTISLIAAIGIQISWVSAIAASIEYAQREHIHHRGRHHGALLTLFNGGGAAAMLVVWRMISDGRTDDHLVSTFSIGEAAMVLTGVSAAVIPFIVFGYHEARVSSQPQVRLTLGERLHAFWRFCHQNVVYRVLLFVIFHLLLLALYNQNVRDAVQRWSGVNRKDALGVEVGRNGAMMIGMLIWKIYFRNVNWRRLVVFGSIFYISSFIVLTTFTTFNVVRNKWFYGIMFTFLDVPRGWLLLFVVHFSGEISDVGHEGVTVGLALSYQRLVALASFMIAAIFPNVVGFEVSKAEMILDTSTARANVTKAFFIGVALNVLCFPFIHLLPRQKLDAQQQRAFGGYNKYAGLALLLSLVVLVCFNLVVNLLTVL